MKPILWTLLLLVAMALPDYYVYTNYIAQFGNIAFDILWWMPTLIAVSAFGAAQAGMYHNAMFRTFFGIAMTCATPKLMFSVVDIAFGTTIALVVALSLVAIVAYGVVYGWRRIVVRTATCSSHRLPAAFDGYRILQLSDIHIGTFKQNPKFISRLVRAVNQQKPDLVVFTGDLVNTDASELLPFRSALAQIRAKDGVLSVMGNHDYCEYSQQATHHIHGRAELHALRSRRLLVYMQEKMGWRMLMNDNVKLQRDNDAIYIIGVENIGKPPFKSFGNLAEAMQGVPKDSFMVLLSHDPTHWRRGVLHKTDISLTLSGHTHAGQVKIGRFSPAKWAYNEWGGKYVEGSSMLYVSLGIGGTMPFRFGAWPEINVITLKYK